MGLNFKEFELLEYTLVISFKRKLLVRVFQPPLIFRVVRFNNTIKAYYVNVVVDIKPIYLNKHCLFQNKIYCLDKIYCCFGYADP